MKSNLIIIRSNNSTTLRKHEILKWGHPPPPHRQHCVCSIRVPSLTLNEKQKCSRCSPTTILKLFFEKRSWTPTSFKNQRTIVENWHGYSCVGDCTAWISPYRRLAGDPDTIIRRGTRSQLHNNYVVVCGLRIEHYLYFINCIQNLNVSK